jgi:quercetin dioxygenase-like cupin family protein
MTDAPFTRIIATRNQSGKSVLAEAGPIPWYTYGPEGSGPDDTSWGADVQIVAHDPNTVFAPREPEEPGDSGEPPPAGAVFRIVSLPPGGTFDLHRTDTIDFISILQGEVWLTFEEGETLVRQGDCVVLHGEIHGWENRADVACRIVGVLLSTLPA